MVEITNVDVYDLEKSIIACRNAMRTEPVFPVDMDAWGHPIYEQKEWDDSRVTILRRVHKQVRYATKLRTCKSS